MNIQPHEPVSGYFLDEGGDPFCDPGMDWEWMGNHPCMEINRRMPLRVTLANGQRVIVRALSEERKAARRERNALKEILSNARDLTGLTDDELIKELCQ